MAAIVAGSEANVVAPKVASDDEILGIGSRHVERRSGDDALFDGDVTEVTRSGVTEGARTGHSGENRSVAEANGAEGSSEKGAANRDGEAEWSGAIEASPELRELIDANPAVRDALDEVSAYRETFASPEAAREAGALAADLNRLDALFYSRRPEDHAELARAVAALDADAFASLAKSMGELAADPKLKVEAARREEPPRANMREADAARTANEGKLTAAQADFFQAANASAVEGVIGAIEAQVEKLLPEGISKPARNRVVGEIYRELDTVLRGNRVLTQQMHDAFRTGRLDADHQKAVVSLVTARARQALPAVAKRVLNEWTNTIVTMNQERRTRQRNAERRVDIAGSGGGNEGRRATTAKDIDYRRMSDADILNL